MERVRKITEDLAIAGQLPLDDLQQLAAAGYRSIVNLRSPDEYGFLSAEQQHAESLGLRYLHIPIHENAIKDQVSMQLLKQIRQSPKPILIHCDNAMRSATFALIYVAVQKGDSLNEALKRAEELGIAGIVV